MQKDLPTGFAVGIGLMLILPLLNYLRDAPIADFYGEWLSAVSLTVAVLFLVRTVPTTGGVSFSLFLAPLVIFVLLYVQWATGQIPYRYDWITWSAYLTLLVLAFLVGQALQARGLVLEAVARLASALIVAALINFALQLVQVAGLDKGLAPFVVPLTRSACRAYGNVGQANHATLLAWMAAFGVLYLRSVGRISWWLAVPLIVCLLLSSALTVSRMAWLFLALAMFCVFAFRAWSAQSARQRGIAAMLLAVGFLAATFISSWLLTSMGEACTTTARRLTDTQEGGLVIRLALWQQALSVWLSSPWLGTGAGLFMASVYQLQPLGTHQPLDYYTHNLVLQILAEFGIFAALAIVISALWWGISLFLHRRDLRKPDVVLLYWIGVLAIHSMLEFPLYYVHFLAMFGICIGLVLRPDWAPPAFHLPLRRLTAVLVLIVSIGCAGAMVEYRRLDRLTYLVTILMMNNFGSSPEVQEMLREAREDVLVYEPMADHALGLIIPLNGEQLPAKIAATERMLAKSPTSLATVRRIALALLAGDEATALWHAERVAMFYPRTASDIFRELERHFDKQPEMQTKVRSISHKALATRPALRW